MNANLVERKQVELSFHCISLSSSLWVLGFLSPGLQISNLNNQGFRFPFKSGILWIKCKQHLREKKPASWSWLYWKVTAHSYNSKIFNKFLHPCPWEAKNKNAKWSYLTRVRFQCQHVRKESYTPSEFPIGRYHGGEPPTTTKSTSPAH